MADVNEFVMPGQDADRIRKLLDMHPLRPIPPKIVRRYQSLWSMLAKVNKGAFSREMLAMLILMEGYNVTIRDTRVGRRKMVNDRDLSTDPSPSAEEKRAARLLAIKQEEARRIELEQEAEVARKVEEHNAKLAAPAE